MRPGMLPGDAGLEDLPFKARLRAERPSQPKQPHVSHLCHLRAGDDSLLAELLEQSAEWCCLVGVLKQQLNSSLDQLMVVVGQSKVLQDLQKTVWEGKKQTSNSQPQTGEGTYIF